MMQFMFRYFYLKNSIYYKIYSNEILTYRQVKIKIPENILKKTRAYAVKTNKCWKYE